MRKADMDLFPYRLFPAVNRRLMKTFSQRIDKRRKICYPITVKNSAKGGDCYDERVYRSDVIRIACEMLSARSI